MEGDGVAGTEHMAATAEETSPTPRTSVGEHSASIMGRPLALCQIGYVTGSKPADECLYSGCQTHHLSA